MLSARHPATVVWGEELTEVALQGRVSLAYPPEGAMWTLDAPPETVTNTRPVSGRQQPKQ